MIKLEKKKNGNITIVNIYNFIRKTVYPSGEFVQDDFETVIKEIELIKQYGFPATYALKHDALMDENFVKLIKDSVDDYDEVGAWFEITGELCEKAGVTWKGETPIDDHVHKGYSLGYSKEDRKKLVDAYMKDFKEIFGYYPKTVGSWVMDIVTLTYFKEKYGVLGAAMCRDQIGTDGFTLWGGYFTKAYYPSKLNEYVPAQSEEMQLDLPIFRLLGPDPIYNFEDGLRKELNGVHTLEPAWIIGQNKEWVHWFFECLTDEDVLGFSYAQIGQENTYLWNTMYKGYEVQIEYLSKLDKEGKIRVETLKESALWYKNKYRLTPPTTFGAKKDWNYFNMKTLWYNSRFFRTSFLFENNSLVIRDLHLFDEKYVSRYYDGVLNNNESVFDTLPLMTPHYWRNEIEERPEISIVKEKRIGVYEKLKGENMTYRKNGNDSSLIQWEVDGLGKVEIYLKEETIEFKFTGELKGKGMLCINTLPVLKELNSKGLICKHNNFEYGVSLLKGEFSLDENFKVILKPEEGEIILNLNTTKVENEVEKFLRKDESFDEKLGDYYIPKYKRTNQKSRVKLRAFRPIVNIDTMLFDKPFKEEILLGKRCKDGEIRYTLDGTEPTEDSTLYKGPIEISDSTFLKAKVFKEGYKPSDTVESRIYYTIKIKDIKGLTEPTNHPLYNKNGVYDLIDGKKGSKHYTDGNWLGYRRDMVVIVDLGEVKEIKEVMAGFLQDTRAWIYYPKRIECYYSLDGENFELMGKKIRDINEKRVEIGKIDLLISKKIKTRYIKVFAENEGMCPSWSINPGEGPTFMFIDQITVR